MRGEDIEYGSAAMPLRGRVFTGSGTGRRPGIVLFPDAWGLSPFADRKAKKVAELGYVCLAADMHGDGHLCSDLDEAAERAEVLTANPARMADLARAAISALTARPDVDPQRVAIMGFCLGGAVAINAALSSVDCRAAISFHGLLKAFGAGDRATGSAPLLICSGADDPLVPMADVMAAQAAMTARQADCQIVLFTGAGHSFTREDASQRPGFGYHPMADRRSWQMATDFLEDAFTER